MNRRSLGKSGLQVSTVGLGCNNFGSRLDTEATPSGNGAVRCPLSMLPASER